MKCTIWSSSFSGRGRRRCGGKRFAPQRSRRPSASAWLRPVGWLRRAAHSPSSGSDQMGWIAESSTLQPCPWVRAWQAVPSVVPSQPVNRQSWERA
jgi:hypothetical protein